jgi:hypothetical protein
LLWNERFYLLGHFNHSVVDSICNI